MTARSRALAAPALAFDRVATDRAALAIVALLVAVSAFLAAGLPRLLAASADAGLRQSAGEAPGAARNLVFEREDTGDTGEPSLDRADAEGARLRAALPPTVGSAITGVDLVADSVEHLVIGAPVPVTMLQLRVQPGAEQRVSMVEGRAPGGTVERVTLDGTDGNPLVVEAGIEPGSLDVPYEALAYEAAVSSQTAELLELGVGDRLLLMPQPGEEQIRSIGTRNLGYALVDIVGRFDIDDPGDPAWFDDPALLEPGIEVVSLELRIHHATALVSPDTYAAMAGPQAGSAVLDPVFPLRHEWRMAVDPGRLDAADTETLLAELARLRAEYPFGSTIAAEAPALRTSLDGVAGRYLVQRQTTEAVLLVAALGPAVAAAGVIALVALLLARRRSAATAIVRSRGASTGQVLASRAIEAVAVVTPAAIAGFWLAGVLVAGPSSGVSAVAAAAIGGAGIVALVAAAWPSARSSDRAASVARATLRPTPRRLVLDLLVVVVALVSAGALQGRGLQPAAGSGPDPLLAAAPALLALAGALLLVRVLPLPVALVAALLGRRRDLVPVLAARAAARRPADSTIPLLVVIVATAAGVFCSIIVSSVDRAQEVATWRQVGADVRLEVAPGRSIPTPVLGATVDGVRARAEVRVQPATLSGPDVRPVRATVLAVDVGAMTELLAGTPVAGAVSPLLQGPWSEGGGVDAGDPIPALVAPALLDRLGFDIGATIRAGSLAGDSAFVIVGTVEHLPGLPVLDRTIVVPLDAVRAAQPERDIVPTHVFVAAEPGRAADVEAAYRELAAPYLTILDIEPRGDLVRGLRDSAMVGALRGGFTISLAISLAYAGLALVAGIVLAAAARAAQLSILRTLGLGRGELRGLVLLEQVPLVVVAVAAGVGLGIGIAMLLVPVLGLDAFTGSGATGIGAELAPVSVPIVIEPGGVVLFAVAPMVVVLGVVTGAAWLLARRDLARSIRVGEA